MSNQDPFETPNTTPPPPPQQGGYQPYGPPQLPVPNATAVLVMGIISIPGCFIYGVVGIVLGIISIVMAKSGEEAYKANPDKYMESSYKNLKAGRICAIIGLVLSVLFLLYIVFVLVFMGSMMNSSFSNFGRF